MTVFKESKDRKLVDIFESSCLENLFSRTVRLFRNENCISNAIGRLQEIGGDSKGVHDAESLTADRVILNYR